MYTPSRRGGPRCRKKPRPGRSDEPKQLPDDVFALLSQEPADVPRDRELDLPLLMLGTLKWALTVGCTFDTQPYRSKIT